MIFWKISVFVKTILGNMEKLFLNFLLLICYDSQLRKIINMHISSEILPKNSFPSTHLVFFLKKKYLRNFEC